jgi:hypothetical protein
LEKFLGFFHSRTLDDPRRRQNTCSLVEMSWIRMTAHLPSMPLLLFDAYHTTAKRAAGQAGGKEQIGLRKQR